MIMSWNGDFDEGEDGWDESIDFGEVTETASNASEQSSAWSSKDAIICLIDSGELMFATGEGDEECAFKQVMRAVIQTYRNKILTSGGDLMSVCFYGTKEKENPSDLPGILLFSDLDVPDGETILKLEQLLVKDFVGKYGRSDNEVLLGEALWTCSTIFGNCATKVGTKRVFLFTNNDNPNANQVGMQDVARQRANDLRQLGIQIELFPINPPSHLPFLGSRFYHTIVDAGEEGDLDQLDGASKLQELLDRARSKEYKKRSLGKLSFFLTPNTEIGIRVYNLVQETKKGSTTLLDSKSSLPIRTISKHVCEDTGTLLLDSQIKHGYTFGNTIIPIEKHELRSIKSFADSTASLKLIGFKPKSSLKAYHNLKHASFIYPDEFSVRGSSALYAALLTKMIQLDKIAICQFTPRSNASLRIVALLPTLEVVKDGIQLFPSGFYIIYLPFADDIRTVDLDSIPRVRPNAGSPLASSDSASATEEYGMKKASEEQIASGVSLVRKLRIQDFDVRNFENPVLQHHYMMLEAIALDRSPDELAIPEDSVMPDWAGMERLSNVLNNFKDSHFPASYSPPDPKQTPGKKGYNPKKRARTEDGDDPLSSPSAKRKATAASIDWQAHVNNGTLSKCTIDQLRSYCTANNLKGYSAFKKQELVDFVANHIAAHPPSAPVKSEE